MLIERYLQRVYIGDIPEEILNNEKDKVIRLLISEEVPKGRKLSKERLNDLLAIIDGYYFLPPRDVEKSLATYVSSVARRLKAETAILAELIEQEHYGNGNTVLCYQPIWKKIYKNNNPLVTDFPYKIHITKLP